MSKELNEKLCRWIGFRPVHDDLAVWHEPQGWPGNRLVYRHELPVFTESMDACVKHLFPKLADWHMEPEWRPLVEPIGKTGKFKFWAQSDEYMSGMVAIAPTPALACCLAIEKLIQEGQK